VNPGSLAPGSLLGDYRILEVLGRGGMGIVFKARDERQGELVALKIAAPELDRDPVLRARLEREAAAAATLSHPNVARLVFHGVLSGMRVLAFELVTGGTLEDELAKAGRLPWQRAAHRGAEIASALAAVHGAGLVHRDLKPANVLIDGRGRAKLADFGLVRSTGDATTRLTQTGEVLGTPAYMSPEQANGTGVDAFSDLYGLGATLYALLTGGPVFEGSGFGLVKKHLLEAPRSPRELAPEVPEELARLVLRLLAKEPRARGRSAESVRGELEALLEKKAPEPAGSRRAAVGAGVAVVALAAGLAFFLAPSRGAPPVTPPVPPAPDVAPPPAPLVPARSFPPECQGFLATKKTTLAAVLGEYPWHAAGDTAGLVLLPGGKGAITGANDEFARIWDLGTGAILDTLGGHGHGALSVAVSRDGKRAIVGSRVGEILSWDLEHRTRLAVWRGHEDLVVGLAFSADGKRALSASHDRTVRLWDVERGVSLATFEGHDDGVCSVAFLASDSRAVSASYDGAVRCWDLGTGKLVWTGSPRVPGEKALSGLAILPGDRAVLTARRDGTLALWNAADGTLMGPVGISDSSPIAAMALSPDGTRVATGNENGDLSLWDIAARKKLATREGAHVGAVVAVDLDGERVVSGGRDNGLSVWSPLTLERIHGPAAPGSAVERIALDPRGERVAFAKRDGSVVVASAGTGAVLRTFHDHREDVLALSFDAQGKELASASRDGTVLRGPVEANELPPVISQMDGLDAAALSPDGRALVTVADDGTLRTYDMPNPAVQHEATEASFRYLRALGISPDGGRVLASTLGTLWLWEPARARQPVQLTLKDDGAVTAFAFAPSGSLCVYGTAEGKLALWDAPSPGTLARPLGQQRRGILAFAFDARGKRLASSCIDGTVDLRSLPDGALLDTIDLKTSHDFPQPTAFGRDGHSLLVGTARGVVLRFDLRD
jgi:WD40 repeat protein